ncbi:hypothetical protein Fleli_2178 [Bernardetia litoralis DSM 6794]|uniref:Lipoprotein n=1 Tax=Bernardetia litoralis (strain ATCC 23117 / DSM 6794 / NBRC 15988 / NCIMB 1366 / Fx l1 / Sio-4) TaxID=880071 RepID=I4AKS2_BERLS|nr:hypothetical protein [Bernardetia litoralis]AFM04557.1 hypothetical protein Fleli_2178 [Bernardetia litoralis DSM 6794]
MKYGIFILFLSIFFSCNNQKENNSDAIEGKQQNIEKDYKNQFYSDFDIFTGNGINPIAQNNSELFPKIKLIERNDSLLVNFWFDDLIEREGSLKFKKESNYFYRIDTLEFDGQKSIWYEYHTKNQVIQFEKYFANKNRSEFKLSVSLLTNSKFQEFDLLIADSMNIGFNSNFLSGKLKKSEINLSETNLDEISPRVQLNEFSIFWHHFLCSGKYWVGYGVSCEYLD